MRTGIFALLFLVFALHGDVDDYFRSIGDKSHASTIRNIDFIYLINLDQRPEKYAGCLKVLSPYGIVPCRFSAINGWELPLEVIDQLGVRFESWMDGNRMGTCYPLDEGGKARDEIIQHVGRTYFCHTMYLGSIGCALSHLSVLQDAWDSGYETIWIMEDDIEIIRDPLLLSELIDKLDDQVGKTGWDILFTDRDTKNKDGAYVPCEGYAWRPNFTPANPDRFHEKLEISPDFRKVGARFGTYSMIFRRAGIKKILNFLKNYQIFLPYDMECSLPNGIRLYTVTQDVVSTQPRAPSDNGSPDYIRRPYR